MYNLKFEVKEFLLVDTKNLEQKFLMLARLDSGNAKATHGGEGGNTRHITR